MECVEYDMEYRAHTIPLFISANILPVRMLYLKTVAAQMHDVSSGIALSKICCHEALSL